MKDTLLRLDELLQEKRPEYYQTLQPGLSPHEIKALEEKYCFELADDLKVLYSWKNGQSGYDSFLMNQVFSDLETVFEDREVFNEFVSLKENNFAHDNFWNINWLPIFANGGGSHICYDSEGIFTGHKGQILEFWLKDFDRNVIASSLENLMVQLINYLESIDKETIEKDEFIEINLSEGFPKKFLVAK